MYVLQHLSNITWWAQALEYLLLNLIKYLKLLIVYWVVVVLNIEWHATFSRP